MLQSKLAFTSANCDELDSRIFSYIMMQFILQESESHANHHACQHCLQCASARFIITLTRV